MARDVTSTDWPSQISDAHIIDAAGGKIFLRAQRYVRDGHVLDMSVSGKGEILTGRVQGSMRQIYQVMLYAPQHTTAPATDQATDGDYRRWRGHCTCPAAQRAMCKHSVALLLYARAAAHASGERITWERDLGDLLQPDDTRTAVTLALHIWPDVRQELQMRPLRRHHYGWTQRDISWSHILAGGLDGQAPPDVLIPLQHLGALSRHGILRGDDPLSLHGAPSHVWSVLRQAVDAGLHLTADPHRHTPVRLESGLRAGADLRTEPDGSLVLTPTVQWEGSCGPLYPVGIGRVHGFFTEADDGALVLLPLDTTPNAPLTRLLADMSRRIVIPAADVNRFASEHLERFVRAVPIVSAQTSLTIPQPLDIRATLRISVEAGTHTARLTWVMRYVDAQGCSHREEPWEDLRPAPAERNTDAERTSSEKGWTLLGDDQALLGGSRTPPDTERRLAEENRPSSSDNSRDWYSERRLATAVFNELLPLSGDYGALWRTATLTGMDTARFFAVTVPVLRELTTCEVQIVGDVPDYRAAHDDLVIATEVDEADTPDWFSLRVRVHVGDEQVPIGYLMRAVAAQETEILLESGTWVNIDLPEVRHLADLMEEGRDLADPAATDAGHMRVTALHAGYYEQLVALGIVGETAERWRHNVERLLTARAWAQSESDGDPDSTSDLNPPESFQATLRPYQRDGYRWLHCLREAGLGGVLADDMGLGKTVQVLADIVTMAQDEGGVTAPVLVVAPTSVMDSWVEQAQRFTPHLRVSAVRNTWRTQPSGIGEVCAQSDIIVTSYTLMRLEEDIWTSVEWSWVIFDEAQQLKNHTTATYKAARCLRARSTLAITGTPLENSLMDLWSIISVAAPGLLPGPELFIRDYKRPIERGSVRGDKALETLQARIRPFLLRRTKEAVAADLPPKTEHVMHVHLTPAHRRAYDQRLARERQKIMGLLEQDTPQARFNALQSLTILRQMALDPGLVSGSEESVEARSTVAEDVQPRGRSGAQQTGGKRRHETMAKAAALRDMLTPLAAQGHQALVFSQFTRYLTSVRADLEAAGLRTLYLDGSTTGRQALITQFRNGEADVFLISLKAGGVGLTLTEADYVFLLDPWWNPQVEEQAVDRAHRIGQDKPVMVYRLVSVDTIEDKVMELKNKKAALFATVIDAVADMPDDEASCTDSATGSAVASASQSSDGDAVRATGLTRAAGVLAHTGAGNRLTRLSADDIRALLS